MLKTNIFKTKKFKLFVIGKTIKLISFKGIKSSPVDYRTSKKAWITWSLFNKSDFDRKIKLKN